MKYLRFKIILKLILVFSIGLFLGYFMIPKILFYPSYAEYSTEFQRSVEQYTHVEQYLIMGFSLIGGSLLIFLYVFRDIFKINKPNLTKEDYEDIQRASYTSSTRMVAYILAIYFPVLLTFPLLIPKEFPTLTVYFVAIATFSWVSLVAIIFSFWVRRDLVAVLNRVIEITGDYALKSRKINLRSNLIITLLMTTAILFTFLFLFGYSTAAMRLGKVKKDYYQSSEPRASVFQLQNLENSLKSVKLLQKTDFYYILLPSNKVITSSPNQKMTNFMLKYIRQFSHLSDEAYNSYVATEQAYIVKTKLSNGDTVYYGHIYSVKDNSLLLSLTLTLVFFILLYIVLLSYWSRNIVKPIKEVSVSLSNVAAGDDIDYDKKLPVTTNDEIGQIVDSYNKIQDLTKEYIKSINEKQDILVKQEQLVTLGELAGGMAHDINTPIAAINYGVDVLSKQVTDEKQKEIIKTMKDCTLKIIAIVNDLRNQIRNLGTNDLDWFKLEQIIKESQVLVHNKLIKNACSLEIDIDKNIELYGERNKFGQVITNILVNAIQAYEKKPGTDRPIIVKAYQEGDNAIIKIIDHAGGIPENMRDTLFKEIMTTKGSEGTGIGMYLAYTVIRSVFKGQITFETATDIGTTFTIIIPNNREKISIQEKQ